MLEKIFWSFAIIVVLGAIFMIVTVVRNKYMGPGAPEHFQGCSQGGKDCSACDVQDCSSRKELPGGGQ